MSLMIGKAKEAEARRYLKRAGLTPVCQNFKCKVGEIDLIMRDREYWVFVEVKYRQCARYGSGLEAVTYHKQQKVIRAAEYYLQKNSLYDKVYCRFDVISLSGDGEVEWVRNAFQ